VCISWTIKCLPSRFMFHIIQNTEISFLCRIKWLVLVMYARCFLLGKRLILNKIQVKFHLRSIKWYSKHPSYHMQMSHVGVGYTREKNVSTCNLNNKTQRNFTSVLQMSPLQGVWCSIKQPEHKPASCFMLYVHVSKLQLRITVCLSVAAWQPGDVFHRIRRPPWPW